MDYSTDIEPLFNSLENFDEAYELWYTLVHNVEMGFKVTMKGSHYYLTHSSTEVLILTEKTKSTLIRKIQEKWGGELGMEGTKGFKDHIG
jgi:hypothetical protein